MLTPRDNEQIHAKGIPLNTIEKQLLHFREGFPFIRLVRPATSGDGIISCTPEEKLSCINWFDTYSGKDKIVKFVPASGAASRMFKHLFEFLDSSDKDILMKDKSFNSVFYFLTHIEEFAFYDDLKVFLSQKGFDLNDLVEKPDAAPVIACLLNEDGLNYAGLPKALLLFHNYPEGPRAAVEEHLVEAAKYVRDSRNTASIHFTLSPEHTEKFNDRILHVLAGYEHSLEVKFDISYSIQKSSTDTLAVDEANLPFRNPDGSLLFRPAGHGALLQNLGDIDADIIFVKNIDNIVPDHLKGPTFEYKKLIGGYLMQARDRINNFLTKAEKGGLSAEELNETIVFAREMLMIPFPSGTETLNTAEKQSLLVSKLNRPVRVCGMVKNEGEPGGGPFWVLDDHGNESLQIVESSQVDMRNDQQKDILQSSTHFNPVDLVCSIRDYKGNKFKLQDFVDESTGLISLKSSGGKTLKAQELPGLWNGSMADWITVFVEVPIITFNPVKTVNDLLRKEHQ